MGTNFWQAQERAKRRTTWMIVAFVAITFAIAFLIEMAIDAFSPEYSSMGFPLIGAGFIAMTFLAALYNYSMYSSQGGSYVAESLGAVPLSRNPVDPKEKQLLNICEEIAVASALPLPKIYVLNNEQINAFAAGMNPDNACVTVTTGALNQLSRAELQGVIAHEFGHISNRDMKLSMKIAAMLMGFFFIFYSALRLLQFGGRMRGGQGRGPSFMFLIAIAMIAAGSISWFAGKIFSSMISREREYLADATSVQFTRSPEGLISALKKLLGEKDIDSMPKTGMAFAHLYFDHRTLTSLFDTHPPLEKRIEALQGRKYS